MCVCVCEHVCVCVCVREHVCILRVCRTRVGAHSDHYLARGRGVYTQGQSTAC